MSTPSARVIGTGSAGFQPAWRLTSGSRWAQAKLRRDPGQARRLRSHWSIRGLLLAALTILLAAGPTSAQEVQRHGVIFEKWVRDTFFGGYEPASYTQKWDIPAEANTAHGHLPANPKAIKWGAPVDLGDALRQFDIAQGNERFLLIVGFWQQSTPTQKRIVNAQAVEVTPETYRALWGRVTRADLERLDAAIKDKSLSLEEARAKAKAIKAEPVFQGMDLTLNPKIDAHQRRLQCSLPFKTFFARLAPSADASVQERPTLFGTPVPEKLESAPRQLPPKKE